MSTIAAATSTMEGANNVAITAANSFFAVPGANVPFYNTGDSQAGAVASTSCMDYNVATGDTYTNRCEFTEVGLIWQDFFFKVVTIPGSNTGVLAWYSGLTLKIADVQIRPNGVSAYHLAIRSASSLAWESQDLAINTWYRIAVKCSPGSATGLRLKIFAGADLLNMNATQDSGDRASGVSSTGVDNFRLGALGTDATRGPLRVRFDNWRSDNAAQPVLGSTGPPVTIIASLNEGFEAGGGNNSAIVPSPTTIFSSLVGASSSAVDRPLIGWGDSNIFGLNDTATPRGVIGRLGTRYGQTAENQGISGELSSDTLGRVTAGTTTQKAKYTVLWTGKNDLNAGSAASVPLANIASIVSQFTGPFVVLGQWYNQGSAAGVKTRTDDFNTGLLSAYGSKFINVLNYLKTPQAFIDAGLSPTSADLAAQAIGELPPSLSSNLGHLNTAGYDAVAKFVSAQIDAMPNAGTSLTKVTQPYGNTYSMRVNAAGAAAYGIVDMTLQTSIFWKFAIKVNTRPVGANVAIISFFNGGVKVGDVQMTPDGRLRLRDNSTERFLSAPIATGAYHEVALKIIPNNVAGLRMKIFSGTARGTATPSQDSLDQASSVVTTGVNKINIGVLSPETMDYTFDVSRADNTTEPAGLAPPGGDVVLVQPTSYIDVEPFDAFSNTFSASGGTAPYTFVVTPQGGAPALSGSGNARTGIAPPVLGGVTLTYSVQVTDAAALTDTKTFTVQVLPQNLWDFATGSAWRAIEERTVNAPVTPPEGEGLEPLTALAPGPNLTPDG